MKKRIVVSLLLTGVLQVIGSAATPVRKSSRSATVRKRKPAPPPVDPTLGDNVDGDDLVIRRAAVAALGSVNGSVVVVDPNTGRISTIVNQKLALKSGFTPCSTIKLVTSLAALSEHVVDRDDWIYLGRYTRYNMTTALAKSNNQYFSTLGGRLGFERVTKYAQMMGLGEKATLDMEEEQAGWITPEPPKFGGVGLMTSFGEGFAVTPLELAALVSAIANGGTLYYLQYPRTQAEIDQFTPKVKRSLDISVNGISDIRPGMRAAVDFGTARRAADVPEDPVFGKTGTCTDFRASSHMGWFASFNEVGSHQLVVVVMLTGGRDVSGPVAAGVAGSIYRSLSGLSYFAAAERPGRDLPEIITNTPSVR
ncbi:MAG: penicillin-binding protein [Terriglobia bacterium]|nr:MAG: penicillin-binding protein [Terriglobia bacterium]